MSASEQEQGRGGQPTPLQPVDSRALGAELVPVSVQEIADGLHTADGATPAVLRKIVEDARRAQERLLVRLGDAQLLTRLTKAGFKGSEYDKFEGDLIAYALPVLRGWLYTGYVFTLTAKRGWALYPSDLELDRLRSDSDLRNDLAMMTIAQALPFFLERALQNGNWSVEGGANLTTYFTGACARMFPNEFRLHRRESKKLSRLVLQEDHLLDTSTAAPNDPSRICIGDQWVIDSLKDLEPKTKAVVELTLAGYEQSEIGEMLDLTERAVEGRLYRFRTAMKEGGGQ